MGGKTTQTTSRVSPMLSLHLAAASFTAPAVPKQVLRSSPVNMAIAKPSKALPFLEAPPCQSSKLIGAEAGFDPLYLSEFIDSNWAREAELKHGRICMLATTGYVIQEFFSIPGYPGYNPNPLEAVTSVPVEGLVQILLAISALEYANNKGKYTQMDMFTDQSKVAGDVGFDPLKFRDNKESFPRLELAELTHGRLAMLGFSGMIHQTLVTGKPIIASTAEIFSS